MVNTAKETAETFHGIKIAAAERKQELKNFLNNFNPFKQGQRSNRSDSAKRNNKNPPIGKSASTFDASSLNGDALIASLKPGGKKRTLRKKSNKRKTKKGNRK